MFDTIRVFTLITLIKVIETCFAGAVIWCVWFIGWGAGLPFPMVDVCLCLGLVWAMIRGC